MDSKLQLLEQKLKNLRTKKFDKPYFVPSLWSDNPPVKNNRKHEVKPASFFLDRIKKIYELSDIQKIVIPDKDWTKHAVIYNMFVRYATAYDHDNNGKVDIETGENFFRETGTFLKAIALLPYLHSLGINTVYMLPITSIGLDGRKGNFPHIHRYT